MYAENNRILQKALTETEKQPTQQNKTPSGKMDLQSGFSEGYNGNPTISNHWHIYNSKQDDFAQMSRNTS